MAIDNGQMAAPQPADALEGGSELPPLSLLFVDDERNILSSLRRLFRPQGYTIHLAGSAKEGLELLTREKVDLVISDMRMPEMDGAQFLGQVAEHHPDIVRILLTGFSDLTSTVEAINKGKIYRYISKPWDDQEIIQAVEQALKTQRLEREKKQLQELTRRQNLELQDLNENLEHKVQQRTEELQQTADMLDLAYKQLSDSYLHTIQVFSSLISMRESLAGRQAQKVAELASNMAKAFKLNAGEVRNIYFAGLLHELGKLSLPDYLIDRPVYCLEGKARAKYQRHPVNGQTALMAVDELQPTANLIRAHEEYYDGTGFPDGLSGDQIPLGARMLSVAKDFYGYQTGKLLTNCLSAKDALKRLEAQSGKQYDPRLVKLLSLLMNNKLSEGPAISERCLSSHQLEAGMQLARNLYNHSDLLLLTKGRVLTDAHIRKLIQLEQSEKKTYEIYVYERTPENEAPANH